MPRRVGGVNSRRGAALLVTAVLALSLAGLRPASGQPIWIGLNFEVHLLSLIHI